MKWMQRSLWHTGELKKFMRIYPFSFAVVLFILLAVRSRGADCYIIEDEMIPLGVVDFTESAPTPVDFSGDEMSREKRLLVGKKAYKVVFEQETGLHLVYSGYRLVGCLQMQDGQSLHTIDESNLLDRIIPYGS